MRKLLYGASIASEVAVLHGVESDDLGEESGGVRVVDPLVLVDAALGGTSRDDANASRPPTGCCPGSRRATSCTRGISGLLAKGVGLEHLDVVELEEQGDEAQHHEDAESSDSSFHQGALVVVGGAVPAVVDGEVVVEPGEGVQYGDEGLTWQFLVTTRLAT